MGAGFGAVIVVKGAFLRNFLMQFSRGIGYNISNTSLVRSFGLRRMRQSATKVRRGNAGNREEVLSEFTITGPPDAGG
jgi:hypothetical protein